MVTFNSLNKKLIWRVYIIKEILPITYKVKLIDRNKFAKAILYEKIKAFVTNINSIIVKIIISLAKKTKILSLLIKKVTILTKYSNSANVFFRNLAKILHK